MLDGEMTETAEIAELRELEGRGDYAELIAGLRERVAAVERLAPR